MDQVVTIGLDIADPCLGYLKGAPARNSDKQPEPARKPTWGCS